MLGAKKLFEGIGGNVLTIIIIIIIIIIIMITKIIVIKQRETVD